MSNGMLQNLLETENQLSIFVSRSRGEQCHVMVNKRTEM